MLDEGFVPKARAKTEQQEREREREVLYAVLQYTTSFHCLVEEWKDCEELKSQPKEKCTFMEKKSQETRHRTEWCAVASTYRCMRCETSGKYMKMPGKFSGPKYLSKSWINGERETWAVMIW